MRETMKVVCNLILGVIGVIECGVSIYYVTHEKVELGIAWALWAILSQLWSQENK